MHAKAIQKAKYEDLYTISHNMIGEIIDGELIAMPRYSPIHNNAVSALDAEIGMPYRLGRGGPGGWWILFETEVRFGEDILVPDLAGWRKERLPQLPKEKWISVIPDWICEVLSPGTVRIDRIKKMTIYGMYGVMHLWLIDPHEKTLETFKLESGKWVRMTSAAEEEVVRTEPFKEIEIELKNLWVYTL